MDRREKCPRPVSYADTWRRRQPLDITKKKILCGITDEAVWRAHAEQDILNIFKNDFVISPDDIILEFGSGIGRIIQALAEKFQFKQIIGLDIGEHTIEYASQRISDPRVSFLLYDGGVSLPFDSDYFDKVYSVLTIQHIDKHFAYFIFQDIVRILKPGGKAVLQIENWGEGMRNAPERENILQGWIKAAENVVIGVTGHWIELYTEEELRNIFVNWLKVGDFKIEPWLHLGQVAPYHRVYFEKPPGWRNRRFSFFRTWLEHPRDLMICNRVFEVSGWAFSSAYIEEIVIEVDGDFRARAECSVDRPDVADTFGTMALRSGFKTTLQLEEGKHSVKVIVRDKAGKEEVFTRTVRVVVEEDLRGLIGIYATRPDLQHSYPEVDRGDYKRLLDWAFYVLNSKILDWNLKELIQQEEKLRKRQGGK